MPDVHQLELMAEVAHLYYEEDYSQTEIARMMNISHSTVSRILQKAQESEVVKVIIRYPLPSVPSLENEIKAKFGLKQVRVFPASDSGYPDLIRNVGQLCARAIESLVADGMVFGVCLGQTVEASVKSLNPVTNIHCKIAMLQGATEDEQLQGMSLGQTLAGLFGGDLKIIPSPWVFKNPEICQILLQEPAVREAIDVAENSDIALVGIGSTDPELSTIARCKYLSEADMKSLIKNGAVGEICGKFFDFQGNLLDVEFNKRTVTIDINRLRRIPTVIGVAAGLQKATAILGAIKGKLINVLVTDSTAANKILEIGGKRKKTSSR